MIHDDVALMEWKKKVLRDNTKDIARESNCIER